MDPSLQELPEPWRLSLSTNEELLELSEKGVNILTTPYANFNRDLRLWNLQMPLWGEVLVRYQSWYFNLSSSRQDILKGIKGNDPLIPVLGPGFLFGESIIPPARTPLGAFRLCTGKQLSIWMGIVGKILEQGLAGNTRETYG